MSTATLRTAHVTGTDITGEKIARYLPANYEVISEGVTYEGDKARPFVVIQGADNAGWTLDDYVIPRLASGLYWAKEVTS
jgi:hypothetical protein